MSTTTHAILSAARKVLDDPKKWTQNAPARRRTGEPCSSRDLDAVCWCAVGALSLFTDNWMAARDVLESCMQPGTCVGAFNDSHTHAEVIAAFDRAIERAAIQSATHADRQEHAEGKL